MLTTGIQVHAAAQYEDLSLKLGCIHSGGVVVRPYLTGCEPLTSQNVRP